MRTKPLTIDMSPTVARCRLVISLIAIVAVYLDPTEPTLLPWLEQRGGEFTIDPWALSALSVYLVYSLAVVYATTLPAVPRERLATVTAWTDVALGAVIMAFTEGTSSPFWAFFVFAVIAAGTHGGFRRSMAVTTVSVGLYLSLILVSWHDDTNIFIMRPVYLAVVGYLAAYLGQQRMNLESEIHHLETARERNRIARELHDGCVQTLGGINLTLETCRQLFRAGRGSDAMESLAVLQSSINREHDDLRAYVRDLAEIEATPRARDGALDTRFVVSADFCGSAAFVEQVLGLVREAITNVRRHASAHEASITVRAADAQVLIAVDDDGVGFAEPGRLPWSIASTVREAGGDIQILRDRPGAHLRVAFPEV
jgi:signal transduction histidine kinase